MKKHIFPRANVLSATVIRLGAVSFFADISSEMLYPITPIFLTGVLGASMLSVGLIEGTAEAISSLLKAYSGTWSDRIQRRRPFMDNSSFRKRTRSYWQRDSYCAKRCTYFRLGRLIISRRSFRLASVNGHTWGGDWPVVRHHIS